MEKSFFFENLNFVIWLNIGVEKETLKWTLICWNLSAVSVKAIIPQDLEYNIEILWKRYNYNAFCILWFSSSEYILTEIEMSVRINVNAKARVRIYISTSFEYDICSANHDHLHKYHYSSIATLKLQMSVCSFTCRSKVFTNQKLQWLDTRLGVSKLWSYYSIISWSIWQF